MKGSDAWNADFKVESTGLLNKGCDDPRNGSAIAHGIRIEEDGYTYPSWCYLEDLGTEVKK